MASLVPEGHPGDSAWRLPVWRTLVKLQLVNGSQLEPANALAKEGGFFCSHLVGLGVNPDKLLTAIAVATGLPSAPRHEVRRPRAELAEGLTGDQLRGLLASPFHKEAGLLHLAFVVPLPKEKLALLPPHKAFVALESDVRDGLAVLFPKTRPSKDVPAMPEFDPSLLDAPAPPPPPRPGNPTTSQLQDAGIVETFITPREELLKSLLRFKWPAAGVLGLVLVVKLGTMAIDSSNSQVQKKSAELRQAIASASDAGVP